MSSIDLVPTAAVARFEPYCPPTSLSPIEVKLDGNEGTTPSHELFEQLSAQGVSVLRDYPSAKQLEAQIAQRWSVSVDRVLVTAGVDDGLDRACRAMLCPGREMIVPVPTFEMIERYVQLTGADVKPITWRQGPYPCSAVVAAVSPKTRAIAVVSPNNPSGAVARVEDLVAISQAAPAALILVDLAYGEFADVDLTAAAIELPNAVVFHTLSKAWGLAGLRVGYAIGPAKVLRWMRAIGQPYAVSGPSVALASAWLKRGQQDVERFVSQVRAERESLQSWFKAAGFSTSDSQANFVLARSTSPEWIHNGLASLGISVRIWPGRKGVEDAVRITCPGNDAVFKRLIHALESTLRPQAVLFDLDGVLADVSKSYRLGIQKTAETFGVNITDAQIKAAKAAGDANNDWILTHRLLNAAGLSLDFEQVKARFEALYQGDGDKVGLREQERLLIEPQVLQAMAEKYPLAIVTGRPRKDAEIFLNRFGIADVFRTLVCMEDAPSKPDPAPVSLALEQLGVTTAWMIGDTPDDIQAARAAGVVPLGLCAPGDQGSDVPEAMQRAGAAVILDSIEQMAKLLP